MGPEEGQVKLTKTQSLVRRSRNEVGVTPWRRQVLIQITQLPRIDISPSESQIEVGCW